MKFTAFTLLLLLALPLLPVSAVPGNITSTATKAVTSTETLVSSPTPQNFSFNPATTPNYFGQDLGQFTTTTAPNGFKFSTAPTDSMTMTLPKVGPSVLSNSLVFFNSTQTAWELVPSVGNTVNVYFKPAQYSVKISIMANLLAPQTVCLPFSSPSIIVQDSDTNKTTGKTTFYPSIKAGHQIFQWFDIPALYAPTWNQVQSSLCLSLPAGLTNIDPLALDGTGQAHCNGIGTCAAGIAISLTTTSTPDVVVCTINIFSSTLLSIADTSGLTWSARVSNVASSSTHFYVEYAITSGTLSGDTITIKDVASNYITGICFGVSGANTGSPWDSNGALPSTATGNGGSPSTSISTSNANDFLIGNFVDDHVAQNNNCNANRDAGFTLIANEGGVNDCAEYQVVSATQSGLAITISQNPANWVEYGDAIKSGAVAVTQPIKITTANGAPAPTGTWSGCGLPNGTSIWNGNLKTVTVTASCTITLTEPTDGSNTRYRWNISPHPTAATAITFPTCAGPGTCSEYDNTTYNQLQQFHHVVFAIYGGYQVNPQTPSLWDGNYSTTLTGTYLGATNQNVCISGKSHTLEGLSTTSSSSGANQGIICTNDWADYDTAVTIGGRGGTTTIGNTWNPSPAGSNVFTETTGANSLQANFTQSSGNAKQQFALWVFAGLVLSFSAIGLYVSKRR